MAEWCYRQLMEIGDENGLFPNETTAELPPLPVADAQMQEREFVLAWMEGTLFSLTLVLRGSD